jgi:hypothetical protein
MISSTTTKGPNHEAINPSPRSIRSVAKTHRLRREQDEVQSVLGQPSATSAPKPYRPGIRAIGLDPELRKVLCLYQQQEETEHGNADNDPVC